MDYRPGRPEGYVDVPPHRVRTAKTAVRIPEKEREEEKEMTTFTLLKGKRPRSFSGDKQIRFLALHFHGKNKKNRDSTSNPVVPARWFLKILRSSADLHGMGLTSYSPGENKETIGRGIY